MNPILGGATLLLVLLLLVAQHWSIAPITALELTTLPSHSSVFPSPIPQIACRRLLEALSGPKYVVTFPTEVNSSESESQSSQSHWWLFVRESADLWLYDLPWSAFAANGSLTIADPSTVRMTRVRHLWPDLFAPGPLFDDGLDNGHPFGVVSLADHMLAFLRFDWHRQMVHSLLVNTTTTTNTSNSMYSIPDQPLLLSVPVTSWNDLLANHAHWPRVWSHPSSANHLYMIVVDTHYAHPRHRSRFPDTQDHLLIELRYEYDVRAGTGALRQIGAARSMCFDMQSPTLWLLSNFHCPTWYLDWSQGGFFSPAGQLTLFEHNSVRVVETAELGHRGLIDDDSKREFPFPYRTVDYEEWLVCE